MPPFPDSFPPKRESITTFDFTDVASGLGFEKFWMAKSEDLSNGVAGILTTLSLTSANGQNNTSISNDDETIIFNTSTFNLPRTLKGICYVQLLGQVNGTTGTSTISAKLSIVHADDSVTDVTSNISSVDIPYTSASQELLELPITQKIVKKGEKIRLTLTYNETNGVFYTLFNDGSESFILIPFRIDLT